MQTLCDSRFLHWKLGGLIFESPSRMSGLAVQEFKTRIRPGSSVPRAIVKSHVILTWDCGVLLAVDISRQQSGPRFRLVWADLLGACCDVEFEMDESIVTALLSLSFRWGRKVDLPSVRGWQPKRRAFCTLDFFDLFPTIWPWSWPPRCHKSQQWLQTHFRRCFGGTRVPKWDVNGPRKVRPEHNEMGWRVGGKWRWIRGLSEKPAQTHGRFSPPIQIGWSLKIIAGKGIEVGFFFHYFIVLSKVECGTSCQLWFL